MVLKQSRYSWHITLGDEVKSTVEIKPALRYEDDVVSRFMNARRRTSVTFAPLPPSFHGSSSEIPTPCIAIHSAVVASRGHSAPAILDLNAEDAIIAISTSLPPPPPSSSNDNDKIKSHGFRPDYSLGDMARSKSHMLIETSPEDSFQSVNTLQKQDFAFVKRSDGSYTYCILAFRSLEPPSSSSSSSCDDDGNKNKISSSTTTSYNCSSSSGSLEESMTFVVSGTGCTKTIKKAGWTDQIRLVSMEGSSRQKKRKSRRKNNLKKSMDFKDDWVPPSIISFVPASEQDDVSFVSAK